MASSTPCTDTGSMGSADVRSYLCMPVGLSQPTFLAVSQLLTMSLALILEALKGLYIVGPLGAPSGLEQRTRAGQTDGIFDLLKDSHCIG